MFLKVHTDFLVNSDITSLKQLPSELSSKYANFGFTFFLPLSPPPKLLSTHELRLLFCENFYVHFLLICLVRNRSLLKYLREYYAIKYEEISVFHVYC